MLLEQIKPITDFKASLIAAADVFDSKEEHLAWLNSLIRSKHIKYDILSNQLSKCLGSNDAVSSWGNIKAGIEHWVLVGEWYVNPDNPKLVKRLTYLLPKCGALLDEIGTLQTLIAFIRKQS